MDARRALPDDAYMDGVRRLLALLSSGEMSASQISYRLASGRWRALQRGRYVDTAHGPGPRARARAAAIDGAVVSHDTAARLHGIDVVRRDPREHVTLPRSERRPQRRSLRIHARQLDTADIGDYDGISATTPARTVVDLLLDADRLTATWAAEHAVRLGIVGIAEIAQRVVHLPGYRRAEQARARATRLEPLSESPLETGIRLLLLDGGLPTPSCQVPVIGEHGYRIRIDLAFPELRLTIEADGRSHDAPRAAYYDRQRRNLLESQRWHVLNFTWYDLQRRPGYVVETVRASLHGLRT